MNVDFVTCDVFTERPFSGNQLLVVPDARGLATEQMQAIAREINFSESTFVLPPDDPRHAYRQRTFVPVKEIPYAGHPTVGTAMVMAWLGKVKAGTFTIEVGFGPLPLELSEKDGKPHRLRMAQGRPAWDPPVEDPELLSRLAAGLGLPPTALGKLPVQAVTTGNKFLIVPLASVEDVARSACGMREIAALQRELSVLGVYVFAFSPDGRIRARGYCPDAGVPEDPATGSAAGPLGIHLALHRAIPGGGSSFVIDQGIEMGRPSEITVEVAMDRARPAGVFVSGSAVRMMSGSLSL